MKKCQKCNFQNEALIDFCWQCGSQLANVSNAGNYYQSAPPTQEFRSETPTYYRGNQTQDFSVYQNNYAPKHQTSVKPTNYGRIAIVLGSIFIFLLMVSGAGAAVAYKVFYRPLVKPCCREEQYKNPDPVKQTEPVKSPEPVKVAPSPKPVTTEKASVSGEKIWVDYGVTENGRLGMRIHVKFSVKNMKNEDSFLAIYFEKSNGTSLKTTNKKFAAKDGTVAVYRSMKPGYDEADYKDFDVFMPYDELNLGRGKYDLKMDADVIMENGDFVGHLDYHEFTYERK